MGRKPVTVSNPSAAGTLLAKRKAKQGILVLQGEAEVNFATSVCAMPSLMTLAHLELERMQVIFGKTSSSWNALRSMTWKDHLSVNIFGASVANESGKAADMKVNTAERLI